MQPEGRFSCWTVIVHDDTMIRQDAVFFLGVCGKLFLIALSTEPFRLSLTEHVGMQANEDCWICLGQDIIITC